MNPRQPYTLPRIWLMTDERMDERWMDGALAALPRGAGIVFRHYATPAAERRALFRKIRNVARRRGLVLVLAGRSNWPGADGIHGRGRLRGGQFRTWPAHSRREALAGQRHGAAALFVSPIFPTRSHPGAATLGPRRAARIAHGLKVPAIALGGMNAARFRRIAKLRFFGWAAIDAWQACEDRG